MYAFFSTIPCVNAQIQRHVVYLPVFERLLELHHVQSPTYPKIQYFLMQRVEYVSHHVKNRRQHHWKYVDWFRSQIEWNARYGAKKCGFHVIFSVRIRFFNPPRENFTFRVSPCPIPHPLAVRHRAIRHAIPFSSISARLRPSSSSTCISRRFFLRSWFSFSVWSRLPLFLRLAGLCNRRSSFLIGIRCRLCWILWIPKRANRKCRHACDYERKNQFHFS